MGKRIKFWIGNQPSPDDRRIIEVSKADATKIPGKGRATVTDLLTGEVLTLRRASCGLPNCMCALAIVRSKGKPCVTSVK